MQRQVSIPHCHPQHQPAEHPNKKSQLAMQVHQGTGQPLQECQYCQANQGTGRQQQ